MKLSVYEGLCSRADELGFDSVQAYIRFWANAESNKQGISSNYHDLYRPETQSLRYLELLLAISEKPLASVQDCLDLIVKEIIKLRALKDLKSLTKNLDPYH